jgi:hypothetical protein
MSSNRTWDAEEVADTHRLDWPSFSAKYDDRTFDAYRIKRGRTRERVVDLVGGATVTLQTVPAADEWETLWSALEHVGETRGDLDVSQESTDVTIEDDKPIGVCFLGDIHAGSAGVDYARLREDLETIRDTDGLYVCGLGDYLDNFKPQAKSGTGLYHSLFASPEEQLAYVATRLRIAKGKWLCLCQGNHDAFDGRWAGIDRLPALAADLDTPYFTERGGTVKVTIGGVRYTIIVKHNYAGKSQINKGNSQRRMMTEWPWEWDNADVACLAHLHEPYMQTQYSKGRVVTMFRTGTYKLHDSWAESGGYRPSYGVPLVVLYSDEHKVVPFHGAHFREGVTHLRTARGA